MNSDRYLKFKFSRCVDKKDTLNIIAYKQISHPIVKIKRDENGDVLFSFFKTTDKIVLMQNDWETLIEKGELIKKEFNNSELLIE